MGDLPTGWGGGPVEPPDLDEVARAAARISGLVLRTPLMPLQSYDATADIYLKPEVLQPVGSFKIRGVGNWALSLTDDQSRPGIATTSAGNTAIALGYMGVCSECRPDHMSPRACTSPSGWRSRPTGSTWSR